MKAGEQTADVTCKCDNPQMDEQTEDFPSVANERGTASVGDTLYQTKKMESAFEQEVCGDTDGQISSSD